MPMNDEYEIRNQMCWYENGDVQSLLKIQGYVFWVVTGIFPDRNHREF